MSIQDKRKSNRKLGVWRNHEKNYCILTENKCLLFHFPLADSSLRGTVIFCFNRTRYIIAFISKITQMLIKLVLWMLRQFLSSCKEHQSGTENYLNVDYEISVSNIIIGIIGIIGNCNCKLKNY